MTYTLGTADESEEIKDILTPVNSEPAAAKHISDRYSKKGAKISITACGCLGVYKKHYNCLVQQ
jgi:hypothetical protein